MWGVSYLLIVIRSGLRFFGGSLQVGDIAVCQFDCFMDECASFGEEIVGDKSFVVCCNQVIQGFPG